MFKVAHVGVMAGTILGVSHVASFVLQRNATCCGAGVGTWPFLSIKFAFSTFPLSLFSVPIAMPDDDVPMGPPAFSPPPNSPTLANTHGSAPKQKRSLMPPEPGPSRTKRSRKGVVLARSKRGKRPSDWHLTKGEIPAKSEATKVRRSLVFNVVLCSYPSS